MRTYDVTRRLAAILLCLALVSSVILLMPGCSAAGAGGAGRDPAAMDKIASDIHAEIKAYLDAADAGFSEEEYADGKIPMMTVTRVKKGDADFEDALAFYGLDSETVQDMYAAQAMMITQSNVVIVLRTSDVEKALAGLKEFHEGQERMWSSYLPDQYEKVKNNVTGSEGDYVYYVTHDAAGKIVDAIKAGLA